MKRCPELCAITTGQRSTAGRDISPWSRRKDCTTGTTTSDFLDSFSMPKSVYKAIPLTVLSFTLQR